MSSNLKYFQTKINANKMPAEVSRFREANLPPRGACRIQNLKQKVRATTNTRVPDEGNPPGGRAPPHPAPPRSAPGASAGTAATGRTRVAIGRGAQRRRRCRVAIGTWSEGRPLDRAALRRSITCDRSTLVFARGDVPWGCPLSRLPATRAKCQRVPSFPLAMLENRAA